LAALRDDDGEDFLVDEEEEDFLADDCIIYLYLYMYLYLLYTSLFIIYSQYLLSNSIKK
jgi:hypothetical protein